MRRIILAASLAALAGPAAASTGAAWAELYARAERACLAATDFQRPHASAPIVFDDSVGKVAILVTGVYPQARMRGASGSMLCLYDKRARKAAVEEAKGWSARYLATRR